MTDENEARKTIQKILHDTTPLQAAMEELSGYVIDHPACLGTAQEVLSRYLFEEKKAVPSQEQKEHVRVTFRPDSDRCQGCLSYLVCSATYRNNFAN